VSSRGYRRELIRSSGDVLKGESDFVAARSVWQHFGEPHLWKRCVGNELQHNFTNPSGTIIVF
jgi:hypothetical protein